MDKIEHSKIAAFASDCVTWEDIELAESYLVSGMFDEAAALASSILIRIHDNKYINTGAEIQLHDMMVSSAMVLVQSWRETGRTSSLMNELEFYFGSVTAIPVQVILIGACVQVSGGHPSAVRDFLEDFLGKWQFNKDRYYACTSLDIRKTDAVLFDRHSTLEVAQYLEVVEFYALKLLGVVLNDVDRAVSWVEKAQLPEEVRQDFLRRLLSLYPLKSTSSTNGADSSSPVEEPESHPLSLKEIKQSDQPMKVLSTQGHSGVGGIKHSIWKWLQNITKRSCNTVVASNGKIFFGCLIFLVCYFIRKKREIIKRAVQRRALSLKQALVDLWQLAFSYQVNPLAAVQPLPATANRSR